MWTTPLPVAVSTACSPHVLIPRLWTHYWAHANCALRDDELTVSCHLQKCERTCTLIAVLTVVIPSIVEMKKGGIETARNVGSKRYYELLIELKQQ